jgi:hypothetical protein
LRLGVNDGPGVIDGSGVGAGKEDMHTLNPGATSLESDDQEIVVPSNT